MDSVCYDSSQHRPCFGQGGFKRTFQYSAKKNWWNSIKKNPEENHIFFQFVERERNLTIKEYRFDYADSSQFCLGFEDENGKITMFDEAVLGNLYMPLMDGLYEGEDCRDIVKSAIEWWDKQIKIIKANIG